MQWFRQPDKKIIDLYGRYAVICVELIELLCSIQVQESEIRVEQEVQISFT